jgi:glycosyltransferase involved in cell wall biosynthesis
MKIPVLTIVVPCFNEEEVFPTTVLVLSDIMDSLIQAQRIERSSKLLFVDDGSRDRTWSLIEKVQQENTKVIGLKLSRNVGHQQALLAGLHHAKNFSDCVISIDADLQDDVEVIREFILKYHQGYEIVYGIRKSRKTDSWFKRTTAQGFYKLMTSLGVNIHYNHADYRLMSARTLEHLSQFQEVNLFLRGIIPLIGYSSTTVYYDRKERFAGESKYPLRKMLGFALNGITSFSITPIRIVTVTGLGIFLLSIVAILYAIIMKLLGATNSGWTSLILSVWFIGGMQLLALGLIGEYIGKIYREVKHRPLYIIEKSIGTPNGSAHSTSRFTEHSPSRGEL